MNVLSPFSVWKRHLLFFLEFDGSTWYKISVNLDQNTWGWVTKNNSLLELYSSPKFDLTCEACGPFILSYWCVVDLVHDI